MTPAGIAFAGPRIHGCVSGYVGACVATDWCVSRLGQAPGEEHGNLGGNNEDAPQRSHHLPHPASPAAGHGPETDVGSVPGLIASRGEF